MINFESLVKESIQNDMVDNPCLVGIHNQGWNCYINSVLQVLSSDILLIENISNQSKEDQEIIDLIIKYNLKISNNNDEVIKKIKLMLETKKNPEDESDLSLKELELLDFMDKKFYKVFSYINFRDTLLSLFKDRDKTMDVSTLLNLNNLITKNTNWYHLFMGRQNDPHEFLSYIQDLFHEMKFKKPNINFDAIYPKGNSIKDKIRKVYIDDFKKRCENKYSMINNNYEYYNLTVIKCGQCKYENLNASPYYTLSLPIPNDDSVSIFNCLNNINLPEELDGYRCEKCKNTSGNFLEKKMITTPKVLVLQLKRFESDMFGNLQKKNTTVDYPIHLNLNEYCFSNSSISNNKFTLFGVICHYGNLNGGHYICYTRRIRNINNEHVYTPWYKCNDERVDKVNEDEVFNHKLAYILFYHRI